MNHTPMCSIRDDSTGEVIMRTPRQFIMDSINAHHTAEEELELHRISADSIAIIRKATQDLKVADKLARFNNGLDTLTRRMDAFVARRNKRRKADAEREQQEIQRQLDAMPDPEEPSWETAGELTPASPSAPKYEEQLEASDQGDLPRELTQEVPVDPGTDPEISGSRDPSARNPVGISW